VQSFDRALHAAFSFIFVVVVGGGGGGVGVTQDSGQVGGEGIITLFGGNVMG